MSRDEDFESWFKKWRRMREDFFDLGFEEMDRMFEEMFKEMARSLPKEFYSEKELPGGGTVRKVGPFIYGHSMTIGPDGKPVIREFGNIKPSPPGTPITGPRVPVEYKDEREPLVDVISDDGTIRVVAELPGVEKKDIKLRCSDKVLTVSVDTPDRKYYKDIELPSEVDPKISKASYKNGVLEVTLAKVGSGKPPGEPIKVE